MMAYWVILTSDVGETANLGNVDSGPEEFQVLPHLLRFVLAVENGQLSEHPHVRPLQAKSGFQQEDKLFKVASVLVVVDELLQLIGVHYDVEPADLGETEL